MPHISPLHRICLGACLLALFDTRHTIVKTFDLKTASKETNLIKPNHRSVKSLPQTSNTSHRLQQVDTSLEQMYENIMDPQIDTRDYTIHDPSRIIATSGQQMIAVTGKAQEDGYDCGIETWYRPSFSGDSWKPGQCLLRTKPQWVDEEISGQDGAYWAPELISEHVLLYSVSKFDADKPNTCIGLATATGTFPNQMIWTDVGEPLSCMIGGDYEEERSIIDPSTFRSFDNELYLVSGGGVIIGTQLNTETYMPISGDWYSEENDAWKDIARGPKDDVDDFDWVEAAYILPNAEEGYYYLFVNWGACCSGVKSTYEIRTGRSENPLGPYVDKNGVDMMDGGGSLFLGNVDYMIGPGHLGEYVRDSEQIFSYHYYDRRRGGNSWIAERRLVFKDGWPEAAELVSSFSGETNCLRSSLNSLLLSFSCFYFFCS